MQDEVSKHALKIYKAAKNPKHTFGEKAKEIFIEIFIIVFAVTLSIWLHGWSEKRHEQKEVHEFLRGLKEDLNKDIEQINNNKAVITSLDSNFNFLLAVNKDQPSTALTDSAIAKRIYFEIPVTRPNIGRYEGFKSSGKIGTIEHNGLKEDILVFYQQTIPDIVYGENFVNSVQLKILDLTIDRNEKTSIQDFATTAKMKGLLGLAINNFQVNNRKYDEALALAKKIITDIDKEIRD